MSILNNVAINSLNALYGDKYVVPKPYAKPNVMYIPNKNKK